MNAVKKCHALSNGELLGGPISAIREVRSRLGQVAPGSLLLSYRVSHKFVLTLFWPSAATIGRAQRIFQEIWVMPESLRQGASHATHLFGTRKYLTCGKSPHMYSSPESKRQCREFGDVICFRGCARHRLNQEQFVHAIRDRKQSLSASDNDLFFT